MNIVEQIKDQIPGQAIGQLSSIIGTSEGTTRAAVEAAVPSLLSWFSGLSSTSGGAQKLAAALQRFDPQAPDSSASVLSERPEVLVDKGSGLVQSLLGSGGLTGIVESLMGSFGIGAGGATKLLGFLTPTVLGGIARRLSGGPITPDSVSRFFSDQKREIAEAMPTGGTGSPLAGDEGLGPGMEPVRAPAAFGPPRGRWVLPVVLGIAVLVIAFLLGRSRPHMAGRAEPPDQVSRLGSDLQDTVQSMTGTLTTITDSATADAALPKLEEAKKKLDGIRASAAQLPAGARAKFDDLIQSYVGGIQEQSQRLASIPGAGEKVKPVLQDLMARLSTPLGAAPADGKDEVK